MARKPAPNSPAETQLLFAGSGMATPPGPQLPSHARAPMASDPDEWRNMQRGLAQQSGPLRFPYSQSIGGDTPPLPPQLPPTGIQPPAPQTRYMISPQTEDGNKKLAMMTGMQALSAGMPAKLGQGLFPSAGFDQPLGNGPATGDVAGNLARTVVPTVGGPDWAGRIVGMPLNSEPGGTEQFLAPPAPGRGTPPILRDSRRIGGDPGPAERARMRSRGQAPPAPGTLFGSEASGALQSPMPPNSASALMMAEQPMLHQNTSSKRRGNS